MLRPLRFLSWPVVLGIVLVSGMGCPPYSAPNYLPAFLITPKSLDFGKDTESLKIKVSKNYTQQPLPEFTIATGGTPWLSVTPKTGNSTGPSDAPDFTVMVDRTKMAAGSNSANLIISAPGVADQKVPVTATALLVADFSATPLLTTANELIRFTDESTFALGEGPIQTWLWTFGDGTQSAKKDPKHKYQNTGTYSVSLTVGTASNSDTAVKQNYITIDGPESPDAEFEASNTSPPANTPVNFTDLSNPGGKAIESWEWSFGDGPNVGSTEQNPTHIYTDVGQYSVSLTVTTDGGQSDIETKIDYIDVQPVGPTADFVASPRNVIVGQEVAFLDNSDPGTSPITAYLWMFGDGATSTMPNPAHTYNSAAAFSVYLAVTTLVGSDAELKINHITVSPP